MEDSPDIDYKTDETKTRLLFSKRCNRNSKNNQMEMGWSRGKNARQQMDHQNNRLDSKVREKEQGKTSFEMEG